MAETSMADPKVRMTVAGAAVVVLIGATTWLLGRDGDDARAGPPEETVYGYVDAYREGDCTAMVGLVSRAVWSDGGRLTRQEYVERCRERAERRAHRPDIVVTAGRDLDPGGERAVRRDRSGDEERVTLVVRSVVSYPASDHVFSDQATLVRQGGAWRLDVADGVELAEGDAEPLDSLDNVELQPAVLDEPVAGFRPVPRWPGAASDGTGPLTRAAAPGSIGSGWSDAWESMGDAPGFGQGFRQLFTSESDPSVSLALTLFELTHDRNRVDDALDDLQAAFETNYTGYRYSEGVPLDVTSVAPDGTGFVVPEVDQYGRPSYPSELRGATVMAAEDDVIVVVEVVGAVGRAASEPALEVLSAQLAQLPDHQGE